MIQPFLFWRFKFKDGLELGENREGNTSLKTVPEVLVEDNIWTNDKTKFQ